MTRWKTRAEGRTARMTGTPFPSCGQASIIPGHPTCLKSYIHDFHKANERGWNLITEKYGRMMESTAPLRYEQIKASLPNLPDMKKEIIEEIVKIQVDWMEEFAKAIQRRQAMRGVSARRRIRPLTPPMKPICGESCPHIRTLRWIYTEGLSPVFIKKGKPCKNYYDKHSASLRVRIP